VVRATWNRSPCAYQRKSPRQSLLIGRRGSYTGPRTNQLVIRTHGFGRGDRYALHIDEGTNGELWQVRIEREQATLARERHVKAEQGVAKLKLAVLAAMDENAGQPVLKEQIKKQLTWSGGKLNKLLVLALALKAISRDTSAARTRYVATT
jgi:hypothetical protein